MQENHYTPFGLELGYAWVNDAGVDTRYRFGGKEFNEDFGLRLNDHGARMYDPAIGRWTSPDPLSPVLKSRSSYEYSLSNPLRFSDPTGMYPYPSAEDYDLGRARLLSGSLSFDNGKASGGVYRSKLNNPDIGSELLKTFSTFIQQSSDEIEQMPEVEGSSGEDMVDYYRQLNAPEDDAQQIRINDLVDPTDAIESGVFQRGAVSFTNNLSTLTTTIGEKFGPQSIDITIVTSDKFSASSVEAKIVRNDGVFVGWVKLVGVQDGQTWGGNTPMIQLTFRGPDVYNAWVSHLKLDK